jgi:hypothetical protein
VETAELKYQAHLHSGRGSVAESVSGNPLQKSDGGNEPLVSMSVNPMEKSDGGNAPLLGLGLN